jgi:type I restriction enzyme S subunit
MKRISLGSIATISSGGTPDRLRPDYWGGQIPWVKTGEIRFNTIRETEESISDAAVDGSSAKVYPSGTLLMAMYGQGKTRGQVAMLGISGAINQACAAISPLDRDDARYLFQYLAFQYTNIRRRSNTGNQENLNAELIRSIPVYYPKKPVRGKIADILGTWDKALEKLDALIAAKERRKQGLMQQLLTGKRRLKGFGATNRRTTRDRFGVYPADWCRVALGEITREVSTRNTDGRDLPVLSCTKHHGLVLSQEYFGRRVHAQDTGPYRVVGRGEFAYATNHVEEGSIGYQNVCEAGLVSPIYTVFRNTDAVDPEYLFRVLKSPLMVHLYRVNTSSSVNRRGSLRYDEFAGIHIWIPTTNEQRAIACVLHTCDREIRLLHRQRVALDEQKRGLMHRLLSGRMCVYRGVPYAC